MSIQAFTILLPFILKAATGPHQRQSVFESSDHCPNSVHIVGIRGTLEKLGFGALQDVIDQLMDKLPGSDSKAIDCPASGITLVPNGDPIYISFQYTASETEGLAKFIAEIWD